MDIAAIFGKYETETEEEKAFVKNMNNMFFTFVKTGKIPQDKDVTLGMYMVDSKIEIESNYPRCSFWKEAQKIVPTYAALD